MSKGSDTKSAQIVRAVLVAGLGYMVWKVQTMENSIAQLQQDVSYIKGKMAGGRGDR